MSATTTTEDPFRRLQSCLRHRTVWISGNSNLRGLYFTLDAILRTADHHNNNNHNDNPKDPNYNSNSNDNDNSHNHNHTTTTIPEQQPPQQQGFSWMDRASQQRLCHKQEFWPPRPSCTSYVPHTNTTLVNTWTQRLDTVPALLSELSSSLSSSSDSFPPPDLWILNIGLDHVATDDEATWKRQVDRVWPRLVQAWNEYSSSPPRQQQQQSAQSPRQQQPQGHYPRWILTPVYHFDEAQCQNPRLTNAKVDLWNDYLLQKIRQTTTTTTATTTSDDNDTRQSTTSLIWHDAPAAIVDRALSLRQTNNNKNDTHWFMTDWVHPNAAAMLAIAAALANVVC